MRSRAHIGGLLVVASCCVSSVAFAQERDFDIPAQAANRAIVEFARQAGLQIVAPGGRLRGRKTRALRGRFEVRRALQLLIEGTGLRIAADANNVITLAAIDNSRAVSAPPRHQAAPKPSRAEGAPPARVPASGLVDNRPILVTGSHVRKDGYGSAVPLTVIDAELIEALGQANAQDVIRLVPQNVASQSDATSGTRLSADVGASYANLRGLNPTFGTRTLTLVNTRRFVPTSDGGQVDLNLIPSVMIARVETVAGGASAAYGSDAVAGVVNIILDDQLDGMKAQIDYGESGSGDGGSLHAAAAYGWRFAENRGRLVVGGEYQRNSGVGKCYEVREWCAQGWGIVVNEAAIQPGTLNIPDGNISGYNVPGSAGYGQPNYVLGRDIALVYNSPYGVIRNFVRSGGTSTKAFNANFPAINPPSNLVDFEFTRDARSLRPYDPGAFGPKAVGGMALGGNNVSAYGDQRIQTPLRRFTTYAAGEYELGEGLTLTGELTYAERRSQGQSFTAATRSTMAIRPDNAFLPPSLAAQLGGASFSLGKDVDAELANTVTVNAKVFRGVAGLSGSLGGTWTWDGYYQYGSNVRHSSIRYSRHNDAFVMALDAIRDSANPARIICRPLSPSLLATFTPAYQAELLALHAQCQPLNLFGQGNMSQGAIDFAWRPLVEDFSYRQHALSLSAQGSLFEGRVAGPIGLATGIDYRLESGEVTHGGVNPNAYAFSFGLDYSGRISVIEGFVETNAPLFRDSILGDLLELNAAIRYSSNTSTDRVTAKARTLGRLSWKLGGIYDPTPGVRLRATLSRDIRAAGFRELFQKTAPTEEDTAQGRVNNPNIAGANKADATPIFTGGNFSLRPERADTVTLGAILSPQFVPGLQLSLDWYRIRLSDAIANLNGQRATDLCTVYDLLCERITFASPTDIIRVDAGQANVGTMTLRGFDFEASYRLELDRITQGLPGALKLRFLLNHQYDFVAQRGPGTPAIDYAGQSGPVIEGSDFYPTPKWMWNLLVMYETGRFNANITLRHIGKGKIGSELTGPEDPGYSPYLPNSISTNRVSGADYVNLAINYALPLHHNAESRLSLFATIDNLLDRKPPIAPAGAPAGPASYPTNPVFFDTLGRRWKIGLRLRY